VKTKEGYILFRDGAIDQNSYGGQGPLDEPPEDDHARAKLVHLFWEIKVRKTKEAFDEYKLYLNGTGGCPEAAQGFSSEKKMTTKTRFASVPARPRNVSNKPRMTYLRLRKQQRRSSSRPMVASETIATLTENDRRTARLRSVRSGLRRSKIKSLSDCSIRSGTPRQLSEPLTPPSQIKTRSSNFVSSSDAWKNHSRSMRKQVRSFSMITAMGIFTK
jgi:hypothetical protein